MIINRMVNPEIRRRFVDSIEYLRKMDFFQDYSNLSSEEILDKIFGGGINYKYRWREELDEEPVLLRGRVLKEAIEKDEDLWMKSSDAEIDYWIIPFDTKRTIREKLETSFSEETGVVILNGLVRISKASLTDDRYPSKML